MIAASLCVLALNCAGEPPPAGPYIVVVATGYETVADETPHSVSFLGDKEIRLRLQSPTLPEALAAVPGILLQKTGNGMTSPFLRGLTSQRIVLVADGARLNNSFLREGPNQYWNQIDPFFYRDLDVMMGPGAILYGSDAIGGVVYARSTPLTRGLPGSGLQWMGGDATSRYASAENSYSEHVEGEIAMQDRWSLRIGLTRQDFGELASGDGVENPNTNYGQWGANVRVQLWLDGDHSLMLGYDHFDQDDVSRVHRTVDHQDYHGTLAKGAASDIARTYDHDRRTAFARYETRNGTGFIEEMDAQVSYTRFAEDYVRVKTATDSRVRPTTLETVGVTLRLQTRSPWGRWNYGVDLYHDWVDSQGWNVTDAGHMNLPQGVVADDATYLLAGAYAQNEVDVTDRLKMIAGLRYTHAEMDAGTVAFRDPPLVDRLTGDWDALTGSVRFLYRLLPHNRLNVFAGISQGFRAPNLSDATREDDFGGGTEAPTADLDEERFVTFEAGLKHRTQRTHLTLTGYWTHMEDRVARLTLAGHATKRNLDHGYIRGIEAQGSCRCCHSISLFGTLAWQEGSEETFVDREISLGQADRPAARMHPLTAEVGLRWEPVDSCCWLECELEMAAAQDHLADAERTDNRVPPGGTPGYAVLRVRGGLRLGTGTDLAVALENVGDKAYRIHGSGVNEPGRNLVVSLHQRF